MTEAVNEKEIEIRTPDGNVDGYLYRPAGQSGRGAPSAQGKLPGVILLTDIGGLRLAYRESAKRLAALGYVVLMPNVFYRTGKPPVMDYPVKPGDEKTMQRIGELRAPLTPEAMERDDAAYVDFLARQEGVSGGPMGVAGYCITGAMAMRMAAARPEKIAAMASFHGGGLYTDEPTSPHRVLPRITARLYFGHAVEDRSMPKEAIEKFERALAAWGGKYESETYEGAMHSWTMPDSPVYNKPQAERAFAKLTELFRGTLEGDKNASSVGR
jgi:carboxymethylenebutenolidase